MSRIRVSGAMTSANVAHSSGNFALIRRAGRNLACEVTAMGCSEGPGPRAAPGGRIGGVMEEALSGPSAKRAPGKRRRETQRPEDRAVRRVNDVVVDDLQWNFGREPLPDYGVDALPELGRSHSCAAHVGGW